MDQRVEIPEEIEHLDFNLEEALYHHRHPTINYLRWCGAAAKERKFTSSNGSHTTSAFSCPRCAELIKAFGANWWWDTHRRHFGSNCTTRSGIIYHDCES